MREYLSYISFIKPLMKVEKILKPRKIQWGGKSQYFLHYTSPEPLNDTLVIYIHGGGWNSHSPAQFHFIGQKIALESFDCIMPSYRKTPKYHYNHIIYDIFAGYSEIKKYISKRNLKYSKIIITGSSAGGHLGALLCFDRVLQKKFSLSPDEFNGFVSLAGPLCFDAPHTLEFHKLTSDLFRSKDTSMWKKGEPILKLKKPQQTKCLIVQSPHDGVVGYEQAKKFCRRATDVGISAEFYDVTEKQNTHSAYCAGIFLKELSDSPTLDKFFDWIKSI